MVKKVLFVCLGNVSCSPIAEAVFLHIIKKLGISDQWEVDSAAIKDLHVGKLLDSRVRDVLQKRGIDYNNRARQIKKHDFSEYDYIFGMDDDNMNYLNRLSQGGKCKAKLLLLGDFDPEGDKIIRDPYYDDGIEGFEKCFRQCVRCCKAFLKQENA